MPTTIGIPATGNHRGLHAVVLTGLLTTTSPRLAGATGLSKTVGAAVGTATGTARSPTPRFRTSANERWRHRRRRLLYRHHGHRHLAGRDQRLGRRRREQLANWTLPPIPPAAASPVWQNTEIAAQFNASPNNQITLGGTVIAHGLTFNAGATGYAFSGGSLTVTAGGITANESVTINAPVTVGAPQTWTTAAGKTLTIGGNVHTVISTLTVGGDGNTYIGGAIDGGGAINAQGAPAGNLVKNGNGMLTIAGASNYASAIALNAGTLALAPQSGLGRHL